MEQELFVTYPWVDAGCAGSARRCRRYDLRWALGFVSILEFVAALEIVVRGRRIIAVVSVHK